MTIAEAIARFLRWCAEIHSAATCRQYKSRLRLLGPMFAGRSLGQLSPLDVADWLEQADQGAGGRRLAPDTRAVTRAAFMAFQAWALSNKLLPAAIVEKLPAPPGRNRTRIITRGEILSILRIASPAFRLAFLALLRSGARPHEICDSQIEHIEAAADGVRVIVLEKHKTAARTGKPRRLVIGRKFGRLVDLSIAGRSCGPIFRTPRGAAWSADNLSKTFTRYRRRAGLADGLVLYSARHRKGTEVCRAHGIKAAQAVLGHSLLTTTQKYVHLADSDVARYQDSAE